jgi:hypothetical protein
LGFSRTKSDSTQAVLGQAAEGLLIYGVACIGGGVVLGFLGMSRSERGASPSVLDIVGVREVSIGFAILSALLLGRND